MLNELKGWLAPNTLTKDPDDRILLLDPAGVLGMDKIYEKMLAEDTGLCPETIEHVVTLYERMCARLLMNGYHISTGLFYAVPRFTGVLEGGHWDPEKNGINVSFTQDKVLREEIAQTMIDIMVEKVDMMYLEGVPVEYGIDTSEIG